MKYWALDYVNGQDNECELVYNDQLYPTEEAAEAAREATGRPDLFDITWYTPLDLDDIYSHHVTILDNLMVSI
jgi:hypothetical protein